MDKQQVAILLAGIASVDDRIDPDDARLEAWTAILDADMTLEFARGLMIKHYANTTRPLMPADFNQPWRNFRQVELDKQWFNEIENDRKELTEETKAIIARGREELKNKLNSRALENTVSEGG